MSCKKAQGFLEQAAVETNDVTDASKERKGRDEALALAHKARRIVVSRGKKVVTIDMAHSPPDDGTLASHLLGPTGNLRAPTLRRGDTLVVGFSDEAYREVLGEG